MANAMLLQTRRRPRKRAAGSILSGDLPRLSREDKETLDRARKREPGGPYSREQFLVRVVCRRSVLSEEQAPTNARASMEEIVKQVLSRGEVPMYFAEPDPALIDAVERIVYNLRNRRRK